MDDLAFLANAKATFVLGEATLADAMAAIVIDSTITQLKRSHWLTSLRSIATAIGRPPESLPCQT